MGKPRRTSCKTNGFPGELLSSGMRPARGRGSRGGADVLTLPGGSVVPRHSAMHDRCIRAAPCLSKRNKLSEPRWAFERQDPAGHMFFCVPDVRSTRPFLVAQWSQTGRGRIVRASRARARRGRELRARFAGRAASMGRGRTSRRRSRARVAGERWRVAGRWSEWRPRRRAGHGSSSSLEPPILSHLSPDDDDAVWGK